MTTRTAEVAVFAGLRGPARTFSYLIPSGLDLEPGHLVRVGLGQRAVAGVVISLNGAVIARELRPVDALVHPLPLLRPHQLALARWIAERYRCGLADAVRAMLPPALASRARSTKLGTARGERTETVFAIAPAGKEAMTGGVRLGARQLVTLRALAAGAVTGHDLADAGGSAVAARALARRGLAIEGTRAVRRIPAEFALAGEDPSRDAVATSAQAAALAAIIAALGSGRGFLLHGVTASGKTEVYLRAAAETLARGEGVIVLVPEIVLTAQVVARFIARVGELGMPPTTIVDLRLELQSGNRSTLSRALRAALQHTVASGEQAILYLNRRGFATVVLCRDCGFVAKCPACDIPYAYHVDGSLVCHRCGRREARAPERCPVCGSSRIRQLGVGTQRVEEEVRAAVPRAKVIRLDRDAVRAKGSHAAAYERMRSGDAQVIVGTQMLAKGFDLPRVTLVGVVNADTILNLPDFTAAERTFQLLTQVLGRSGRGEAGGRGIVQTYLPEHYAVRAAAAHDYVAFAEAELEGRRRFGYPPFGRLVLLSTQAKKVETVERRTAELAEWLRDAAAADAEVLGPAPAFAAKRAGSYRAQIVLRGAQPEVVLDRVSLSDEWTVDIDPVTRLGGQGRWGL